MASFTDIYKQELKGKGVLSSLGSAALKRTKERLDPRNMLFGGTGILSATGQKIFGKGYSAINRSPVGKKIAESGELKSEALNSLLVSSQRQEAQLTIIAKNSMNNNAMARDMNVMRQNMMKLVTLSGGKASRGADMFFKNKDAREAAYESQFSKTVTKTATSPTPIVEKKDDGRGGILGLLLTLGGTIVGAIKDSLSGIGSTILEGLSKIFTIDNLVKALGFAKEGLSAIFRVAMMVATNPVFLALAGMTAVAGMLDFMRSDYDKRKEEYLSLAKKKKEEGLSSDEETKLKELDTPTLRSEALKQLQYDPIEGRQRDEKTPGQIAAENSRKSVAGRWAGTEYETGDEKASRMRADAAASDSRRLDRSPSKVLPGEGEVSEQLVAFIKKKEGFSANAYKDHKQYSIGYGTKANRPDEVITEAEADKRLREHLSKSLKDVVNFGKKYNYDWNQNQIDALTSFVYNLGPGALNQLTAGGKRSNEEIMKKIPEYNKASGQVNNALVKRRNEELAMFSSPVPSSGSSLDTASTASSDMRTSLATQQTSAPVTIATTNSVNNTQAIVANRAQVTDTSMPATII